MDEPKIVQKGPYVKETEPGQVAWCACGRSSNQPFCNGSHKETSFSPVRVTIEAKKTIAWCGCKHTKTPPYCDGSHKNV